MELRTLRTFQRVAQLKSFSKAAAALGYTQAAVTIQIQQLEKELHTRLFDRFGKTISLTQQGTIFYDYACRILDESEKAKLALQEAQELEGHLRIGMTESLCASSFPKLLHAFHTTYPHISISVETSSPEILLDMMNHNELDQYALSIKQQVHPYLEIGNTEFIIRELLSECEISFLPAFCVQPYVDQGRLSILRPRDFQLRVYRQIVYHKSKWLTPHMNAFLSFAS